MIAVGQFTIYDFHDVHSSPTAPTNPVKDMVWLDTSVKPPLMRVWDGKAWVLANDFTDEIDKKADSDDVYNKNEVYTKTETDSKIKVAKDGIDLSVSKLQTTVNNHTTQINNKADLNDVNQKINDIKIGGTNLLRNGNFAREMEQWSMHDPSGAGGSDKTVTVVNGNNQWTPLGKKILEIRGTMTTNRYGVASSIMKLDPNTQYTVSGYCAGHRVEKIQINVRDMNNSGANIFTKDLTPVSGGATLNTWYRFELTFTTTANTDFALNLYSVNFKDNGFVWFCDVQIQKGTKATAFVECDEDVQDAINNKANTSDVYNKEQINDSLQGLIDQTKNLQDEYSNLVDDKKITPNEKIQLKSELAQIQSKTEAMEGIVDALKDSTLSTYMNTLKQKKADVEAKLNPILANMTITSDVSETDVHAAINAFYEAYEVALKLAQMSMNATLTETKTQLSVVADGMNVAINKSQEALDMKYKVGKHFNFTDQGWVEIFASINGQQGRFKTQITDQQLAFTDSGNVVAYLSNQELFITMARIVNALQIGNIGLETSGDKGGIIFKWRD